MGRLKQFLIEQEMQISGNWIEKDHLEYLAWRKQIEEEELHYEQKRIRSLSHEQESSPKDR